MMSKGGKKCWKSELCGAGGGAPSPWCASEEGLTAEEPGL